MPHLRIGVDVGGTNTDAVILDVGRRDASPSESVLAWHKAPTTSDPSHGIEHAISALLTKGDFQKKDIASITIGTTQFINAVVERDASRLAPVAVIRLCGPFSRTISPGVDWPSELRHHVCAHTAYLKGGLEIDGSIINTVDEAEVASAANTIKLKGIKVVVINGIFSPSDFHIGQEELAREVVKTHYPEADVVLSKDVSTLGFIERENAAILNASILSFARRTILAFQRAITRLGFSHTILFLAQNDGTVLPATLAARLPIRTFASGPTNSMCGAAYLTKGTNGFSTAVVVDIGGTSTDVGVLQLNGLPRQAAATTELSGVRTNLSYPDIRSIGLGGGSIVRKAEGRVVIGPDSVGHLIKHHALLFGGTTPTATDYAVAASRLSNIGDLSRLPPELAPNSPESQDFEYTVKRMIEQIIDQVKTSPEDVPVVLVGGGAIIAPTQLKGASEVIRPPYAEVANAIGAALTRIAGTVDTIVSTTGRSTKQIVEEVAQKAIHRAVDNGARRESITIAEMDAIPIQYVADKTRVIVKAIGEYDYSRLLRSSGEISHHLVNNSEEHPEKNSLASIPTNEKPIDAFLYKPKVINREWYVSEIDAKWMSYGCYILGTGGGGTPYPNFIMLRELLRKGGVVKVISPDSLKDNDTVACGGLMGSPQVSIEKLPANEMMEAQRLVYDHVGFEPTAVMALEVGGGNGLTGMILGCSTNMNIPCVDGDWMGRAYPLGSQITPVVYESGLLFLPSAISDGNGNAMIMPNARSEEMIERVFRAALSEVGSYVGCAKGPFPGSKTKKYIIENTLSLAWRIGRAVALCRQRNMIDRVDEAIINEVGGPQSAKALFRGKIVAVERKLIKGHAYGEVIIDAMEDTRQLDVGERMLIPFKNENIIARVVIGGNEKVVASVPDLICVIDAQSGEAIGTPEYRYGLMVVVIGITGSPRWTSTARGLEIGGPQAFGMDNEYEPLGIFSKPKSVINEYSV